MTGAYPENKCSNNSNGEKEFKTHDSTIGKRKTASEAPTRNDSYECVEEEQVAQDIIVQHMHLCLRSIKENKKAFDMRIQNDKEAVSKLVALAANNEINMKKLNEITESTKGSSPSQQRWVWVLVTVICMTYMAMIIFIRLFKKPKL